MKIKIIEKNERNIWDMEDSECVYLIVPEERK